MHPVWFSRFVSQFYVIYFVAQVLVDSDTSYVLSLTWLALPPPTLSFSFSPSFLHPPLPLSFCFLILFYHPAMNRCSCWGCKPVSILERLVAELSLPLPLKTSSVNRNSRVWGRDSALCVLLSGTFWWTLKSANLKAVHVFEILIPGTEESTLRGSSACICLILIQSKTFTNHIRPK